MRVLAIDPGNTDSAYVIVNAATRRPIQFAKIPNDQMLNVLSVSDAGPAADRFAIEMIASYGMSVGADVFETCVWIGRFRQLLDHYTPAAPVDLVKRHPVKMHHCHSAKAKDTNIRQALVDRFASGARNHGKGTKAAPGWFYGFHSDVWQAYALAVYIADTTHAPEECPF